MKLYISPVRKGENVLSSATIIIQTNNIAHGVEVAVNTAHYFLTEWYVLPVRISVGLTDGNDETIWEMDTVKHGFDHQDAIDRLRLRMYALKDSGAEFA